jgi:general secretion pathway protein G
MRARRGGFTLLEIIVVVILLSLLISMVGVKLVGQAESAKRRMARTMVKGGAIAQALDRFYLENGFYPTTQQGLEALVDKPSGSPEPQYYDDEGYLDEVDLDPWNMPYQYACPGTHNTRRFDLWSMGRDRQSGTDDDIGNWRER